IDKLSSYNLFNYLFPGFLFVIVLKNSTSLIPEDRELNVISVVVVIYFIGLSISRIGSLVIEESLKRIVFIGKILTNELFEGIEKRVKIEIIFEAMNMYRSLASMSLLLFIITMLDGFLV
ncbi:hypothetical protein LCGC14_1757570, partial [marine sediment metagenome]